MRELQIVKWCDVCWLTKESTGRDPEPATVSWTVGIVPGDTGRPAPKVLDLCDAHVGPLEDLAQLMSHIQQLPDQPPKALGRPRKDPDGPPAKEHRMDVCPVCEVKVQSNVMVHHVWTRHRDDPKPPIPEVCPTCGAHIPSSQGMATHRRVAHNYNALQDALSGVPGFGKPQAATKHPRRRGAKAIENGQPELEAAEA